MSSNSKPRECEGCPLYTAGIGFVPPSGTGGNGIGIMGEAPSTEELREGKPFVGPSGKILTRILETGKLNRDDYFLFNTIQCQAPDNNLEGYEGAIHHCAVHRDAIIARFRPKLLIALGDTAFRTLTGESGISDKRGYHYQSTYNIPVIGTYHPAYLIYDRARAKTQAKGKAGMSLMQSVIFDIKIAPTIERETPRLTPAAGYPELLEFATTSINAPWLAADIETPNSKGMSEEDLDLNDPSYTIDYCSLAIPCDGKVWGISFPWIEPYIGLTKTIFINAPRTLWWNKDFDRPRLRFNGVAFHPNEEVVDVMWLFHFNLSDLPKKLGSAASYYLGVEEWKSEKDANLPYYSAMDSWATGRLYEEITKHLTSNGSLATAHRHVTLLLAVLERMSKRGVNVDLEALEAFRIRLSNQMEQIAAEMDALWPPELRSYHPAQGYVRVPTTKVECDKCTDGSWVNPRGRTIKCLTCKGTRLMPIPDLTGLVERVFIIPDKEGNPNTVTRWCRILPYNPASPIEIVEYATLKGHTLTAGTRQRPGKPLASSEERYLSVLQNRYRDYMYEGTIAYRGLNKLVGTYTNWPLFCATCEAKLKDRACPNCGTIKYGRIHTRYTLVPASGRLSSTQPNVTNIPNDEEDEEAMAFRSTIVAKEGHVFVKADYRGIEAVLTGWFAGDAVYMDLALKGAHAYNLACYLRDMEHQPLIIPDRESPEFVPFLKKVKKDNPRLYSKIKKVGHGINYGEGAFKIFDQNPGMFTSRTEAKKLWAFIRKQIGTVIAWQNRTVLQAGVTKKVVNPFKRQRWFFDIPGEDGPAAIAQLPQSTAADIIIEAMLAVDSDPIIGNYLVWMIHDELILDVPVTLAVEAAVRLKAIMERPIPELGGLVIGVDVKTGRTLAG